MINRRTLLKGSAGLAISSALAGCSADAEEALTVSVLEGSIPSVVLKRFQNQLDTPVRFQTVAQVQSAFQALQRWQQPQEDDSWRRFMPWRAASGQAAVDDLVSLGDYWLTAAIAQELIEPLPISADLLGQLPAVWQQFVTRDRTGQPSLEGEVWAAPYRLQPLVIVYRASRIASRTARENADGKPPFSSWRDLLVPELRQSIALPEHPNLVIALLQKLQNGRFNPDTDTLEDLSISDSVQSAQLADQLTTPFNQLHPQVRTYDASTALKALINEDVKVVVAWSADVAVALKRYRDLRSVIPDEGTLLSADLWVRPRISMSRKAADDRIEAARDWISFCWQTAPANEISARGGISPIFLTQTAELPEPVRRSHSSLQALRNSEPLLPLSEPLQTAYLSLWQQLRTDALSVS